MDPLDAAVDGLVRAQEAEQAAKDDAARLVAEARAGVTTARQRLHAEIVAAYGRGLRQRDIVERTGLTRESVRRILRAGGVEAE